MNEDQARCRDDSGALPQLPWSECELFCIHSYAGEAGLPCGWRGKSLEANAESGGTRVCPRCGRATLLPIPFDVSRQPRA